MLSKQEVELLQSIEALHWYVGVLASNPKTRHDTKHAIKLGSLIAQLNGHAELTHICGLSSGTSGLTKEKEYEYIGRGFVDPFYSLTHTEDECINYVHNVLGEKNKEDLTGIKRIRALGCNPLGMKAMFILIPLIIYCSASKLGVNLLEQLPAEVQNALGKKRFIAELSLEQRSAILDMLPKEMLEALYISLGLALALKPRVIRGPFEPTIDNQALSHHNSDPEIFLDIIKTIQNKNDHFPGNCSARDAYQELIKEIIKLTQDYFKADPISADEFNQKCKAAFAKAHLELDKHRGWSEFLINLVIGVLTLGIGLLIKGAINYSNNRHFFFVHETASNKQLQEAQVGMEQMVYYGLK